MYLESRIIFSPGQEIFFFSFFVLLFLDLRFLGCFKKIFETFDNNNNNNSNDNNNNNNDNNGNNCNDDDDNDNNDDANIANEDNNNSNDGDGDNDGRDNNKVGRRRSMQRSMDQCLDSFMPKAAFLPIFSLSVSFHIAPHSRLWPPTSDQRLILGFCPSSKVHRVSTEWQILANHLIRSCFW